MPAFELGDGSSVRSDIDSQIFNVDFGYQYPNGLNLRPGSATHDKLLSMILSKAKRNKMTLKKRYSDWEEMDRTLTAYVELDDDERATKQKDPRKPVSIVVPVTFAVMEVILTYFISLFLENPVFRYSGYGDEDTVGAMLLEREIQRQVHRSKMGLNLIYQWRDMFAYGIGALGLTWDTEMEYRMVDKPLGFQSQLTNEFRYTGMETSRELVVAYEGNKAFNIDPYNYIPDASVAAHNVNDGQLVGWVVRSNRVAIMREEESGDKSSLFNGQYLKFLRGGSGKSSLYYDSRGRSDRTGVRSSSPTTDIDTVDKLYMYMDIIPSEFELSGSDAPERWLFCVAGDTVIIQGSQMTLNHMRYPVVVAAPDSDGYSCAPVSRLEVIDGLTGIVSWYINSHVLNQRKSINDMLVVDPSMVFMKDLRDQGPGRLIRTRKSRWGSGTKDAVTQLKVEDITRQHMNDAMLLIQLIEQVIGVSSTLQGSVNQKKERVSAEEISRASNNAVSRLFMLAKITSMQSMQDLAYMLASHTQQLMTEDTWVQLGGRYEERLLAEYGLDPRMDPRIRATPKDLRIVFDVIESDHINSGSEDPEVWVRVFEILASNPEFAEAIGADMGAILKHLARMSGAKNVGDFIHGRPVQRVIKPDDQVLRGAEAGRYRAV